MSNLAPPAPRVEPAKADRATYEAPGRADLASQSEPVCVSTAPAVEPALIRYDNPIAKHPQEPDPHKSFNLSVVALRQQGHVDFECWAGVLRGGAPSKNILQICLPCIYGERDFATYSEVKKYVLIQNKTTAFIYNDETDPSPLYAMALEDLVAVREDRRRPDPASVTLSPLPNTNLPPEYLVTVLLRRRRQDSNGKLAYQFTFNEQDNPGAAQQFLEIVEQAAATLSKPNDPIMASVVKE